MSKIYGGMMIQSAFGLDKIETDSPDQRINIDGKEDYFTGLIDIRYNSSAIRLEKAKFLLRNRNHNSKDYIDFQQSLLSNHLIIDELNNSPKVTEYNKDKISKY
jgi:hypothetical protein